MSHIEVAGVSPGGGASSEIDLQRIVNAIRDRWRWIVVPTSAALVLSGLFVSLVSPRYTAETRVLIENRESFYTRPAAATGEGGALIDTEAVASQVQIITSRDLAREAIRRLGLVGNPEFDPAVSRIGMIERLTSLLGLGRGPDGRAPEDRVLTPFFDAMEVYPAGRSRVLTIEFQSRDPDLAARAANGIAELYLESQEQAKKETARSASVWLSNAIEDLRGRVTEAEARVEAFRSRAGLFASGTTTITSQQMTELSTQLATARAAQADSQAKAQLIRELIRDGRTIEIPDVANNELIRRLSEQRVTLRSQRALELRTLLPEHPRIKELNAQLEDLDRQMVGAAQRTVRTLEAEAEIAGARVERLTAALDAQKVQVSQAGENEVQLRALEREARTQREQLEAYLARFREASARDAENATPPDARIVSRAVSPLQPAFPKKLPIIILATLATFIVSLGALVISQLVSSTRGRTTEHAPTSEPNSVAVNGDRRDALALDAKSSALSAGGLGNDTRLIASQDVEQWSTLLAAPPIEGRGRRVLLVRTDKVDRWTVLEKADQAAGDSRGVFVDLMSAAEGPSRGLGFLDLVSGEAGFVEIIARASGTHLHMIEAGQGELTLLARDIEGVEMALTALEQTYDVVFVALDEQMLAEHPEIFDGRIDNTIVVASDVIAREPQQAADREPVLVPA